MSKPNPPPGDILVSTPKGLSEIYEVYGNPFKEGFRKQIKLMELPYPLFYLNARVYIACFTRRQPLIFGLHYLWFFNEVWIKSFLIMGGPIYSVQKEVPTKYQRIPLA